MHNENEEEKGASEEIIAPKKTMDQYNGVMMQNTEFFSTYNPDEIEEEIINYLQQDKQCEPSKCSADKYKMEVNFGSVGLQIKILKVTDSINCVKIGRLYGDKTEFITEYQNIKKHLNVYNDAVYTVNVSEQIEV